MYSYIRINNFLCTVEVLVLVLVFQVLSYRHHLTGAIQQPGSREICSHWQQGGLPQLVQQLVWAHKAGKKYRWPKNSSLLIPSPGDSSEVATVSP